MNYKGYTGHFAYDDQADIFHGQVLGIRDVITFQGRSIDELKAALQDSVDDYVEMCAEAGKKPEKPFSGKFSLRLPSELHRRVTQAAAHDHTSLNRWVTTALESHLQQQAA